MNAQNRKISTHSVDLDRIKKGKPILEHGQPLQIDLFTHGVLCTANSRREIRLITRFADLLSVKQIEKGRKLSEARLEKILDALLEGEPRAEVDLKIEQDNAALRAEYIQTVKSYSVNDIRSFQLEPLPKNPSDPAARWKREKRIFAISHAGSDLFPAFQFQDGKPHPSLKKALARLPPEMSPWQIAFWFVADNGWLDGRAPCDALNDIDAILDAADRLVETASG